MFGENNKPEAGITLIASNCEIAGDVHFSDQLQVNGLVKGTIHAKEGSKAKVTISEKGCVKGDIRVPHIVVNGKVIGDIYSDKHIELAAKAEITGNVYYSLIEMVMGSKVDGKLVHIKTGKEIRHEAPSVETSGIGGEKQPANPEGQGESEARPTPVTAVQSKTA